MVVATSIGKDLWQIGIPVAEKAIRTGAVYGGIIVLLRLGGKRDLAQLNSFDLVVLLLLSNVVQNAVIGNDNSLAGGLFGAGVLVGVNAVVVRTVRRSDAGVMLFEGTPEVLVRDGQIDMRALHRLGLRRGDVVNAVRRQGASTLDEVDEAVLQPGGSITVTLQPGARDATAADVARLEAKLDTLIARLN